MAKPHRIDRHGDAAVGAGERVLRYPLVQEGRRVGPSNPGRDLGLWVFESTAELVARLPASDR